MAGAYRSAGSLTGRVLNFDPVGRLQRVRAYLLHAEGLKNMLCQWLTTQGTRSAEDDTAPTES